MQTGEWKPVIFRTFEEISEIYKQFLRHTRTEESQLELSSHKGELSS